jgi:hypothetical protein
MKVGELVELSAYGRNLKWLEHSFNEQTCSRHAVVLYYYEATENIRIAFHRLDSGKTLIRTLPRKAFRKAKVV